MGTRSKCGPRRGPPRGWSSPRVGAWVCSANDGRPWKRYAQAHRKRLADMFAPKLRLPADVIPLVVDFWANVGMY